MNARNVSMRSGRVVQLAMGSVLILALVIRSQAGADDGVASSDRPLSSDWFPRLTEMAEPSTPSSVSPASQPNEFGVAMPPAEDEAAKLAKAAQNPVADMISVPLQSNFNFYNIHKHVGPLDYHRHTMGYLLNVQPVIPVKLNEDWNAITRTIIPIINQPSIAPGMDETGGLGDIQFTPFFSPRKPGKIIWGVGPALVFPTGTDDSVSGRKWSAGPSFVVLTMHKQWVFGILGQNIWSYAGPTHGVEEVNQMLLNPFVNYNLPKGWYLTTAPNITANWKADSGEQWTVPVGGGIGRLMKVGKLPVNMQVGSYYNVVHPTFGPEWQVRFQMQFLFPK